MARGAGHRGRGRESPLEQQNRQDWNPRLRFPNLHFGTKRLNAQMQMHLIERLVDRSFTLLAVEVAQPR
jgi:hypothetical protein